MPSATVTPSNRLKYDLVRKVVDFSTDAFKLLLVRSGFQFNQDTHRIRANFKGWTSQVVSFTGSTIVGTGFSAAGFISGCAITTSNATTTSYNTSCLLTSATDTILYTNASWANGTSAATITIVDELPTAYGYTSDTTYLSGVTIGNDDANDWVSILWATNASWLAAGGSFGPTPGAIIIDDTASTIVGYISFASAEMTAIGNALVISGVTIRIA